MGLSGKEGNGLQQGSADKSFLRAGEAEPIHVKWTCSSRAGRGRNPDALKRSYRSFRTHVISRASEIDPPLTSLSLHGFVLSWIQRKSRKSSPFSQENQAHALVAQATLFLNLQLHGSCMKFKLPCCLLKRAWQRLNSSACCLKFAWYGVAHQNFESTCGFQKKLYCQLCSLRMSYFPDMCQESG